MIFVYDYESGDLLPGAPTPSLVEASEAAGFEGAVSAYFADGMWHYVEPSQIDFERKHRGRKIRTVYVNT